MTQLTLMIKSYLNRRVQNFTDDLIWLFADQYGVGEDTSSNTNELHST